MIQTQEGLTAVEDGKTDAILSKRERKGHSLMTMAESSVSGIIAISQ